MDRLRRYRTELLGLFVGILVLTITITFYITGISARRESAAKSVLINCQQVEIVKAEIQSTIKDSLTRLPEISYYKTRPEELENAIEQTNKTIKRFNPLDCYELPIVKSSNLKK